jgi:hypothetical protein
MSFTVAPSAPSGLSSGSSLLTLTITMLLVTSPSQFELALAPKSAAVNVWYWWFGGHIEIEFVVNVITGKPF